MTEDEAKELIERERPEWVELLRAGREAGLVETEESAAVAEEELTVVGGDCVLPITGSLRCACAGCGRWTWLAPTSLTMMRARTAAGRDTRVVCWQCAFGDNEAVRAIFDGK